MTASFEKYIYFLSSPYQISPSRLLIQGIPGSNSGWSCGFLDKFPQSNVLIATLDRVKHSKAPTGLNVRVIVLGMICSLKQREG